MNMSKLYNPEYDSLDNSEKQEILKQLGREYNLKLLKFENFAAFGKTTYTAVYLSEDNSEFVFVPGEKVRLGLDLSNKKVEELFNEENLMSMAYTFMEYDIDEDDEDTDENEDDEEEYPSIKMEDILQNEKLLQNVKDYLLEILSSEEECTIHPLFVERYYRETCWKDVSDEELRSNSEWQSKIKEYESARSYNVEIHKTIHFHKENDTWRAKKYEETTFKSLLKQVEKKGYSLPTKREWEYFAGKGCRTIFPWGNNIDYSMNLKHFEIEVNKGEYTLEKPNFFGLVIADDPYQREIVFDNGVFAYKGGDGGCNICGGLGEVFGYFPTSPYFENDPENIEENINGGFDFYRRVIRLNERSLLSSIKRIIGLNKK